MTAKLSSLFALALSVALAAPAVAQVGEAEEAGSALHEDLPPSAQDGDEDVLDRWQREDDADRLEEKHEQRRERQPDKQVDKQLDEQLDQPEPE
jgi:TolA-binding protein